jgi:predicted dehydrogenase
MMIDRHERVDAGALSRRQFVATTAAAASALLAGPALLARAPRGSDKPQLKVGLIGCGGRGSGAALQALAADDGAVLFALADVFPDRIQQSLANIRGELQRRISEEGADSAMLARVQADASRTFSGFDGYENVIALCDVVILATPPHFRPAHLSAAVQAGRHVFCEKPVAVDAAGVRSVLESARIAQQKNLSLMSGFCWRYSAREREAMGKVLGGAVGDVRAVYTTYNTSGWVAVNPRQDAWSDMEFQLRNWHYFTWLSGDHIVEQACHSIDKMAWAMAGLLPVSCTAVGGRQTRDSIGEPGDVFDHFAATFEFKNGARGFHMCRHFPSTPFDNSDLIIGTRGTCRISSWADILAIDGENPWTCVTPKDDMYQQEHNELFASIRAGRPINDGVWMAHSTLMSIMARMAAYTGQAVTWEQALNSQQQLRPESYEFGDMPAVEVPRPGITRLS